MRNENDGLLRKVKPYKLFDQFLPVEPKSQESVDLKIANLRKKVRYPSDPSLITPYQSLLSNSVQVQELSTRKWVSIANSNVLSIKEYKKKTQAIKAERCKRKRKEDFFLQNYKVKMQKNVYLQKVEQKFPSRSKSYDKKFQIFHIDKLAQELSKNHSNYHNYLNYSPYFSQPKKSKKNQENFEKSEKSLEKIIEEKVQMSKEKQVLEEFIETPQKNQKKKLKLKPLGKLSKKFIIQKVKRMKTESNCSIKGWTRYEEEYEKNS